MRQHALTSSLSVLLIASCVSMSVFAGTTGAQSPSPDTATPQVMVLASHHMGNPGLDLYNVRADDVRTPTRQRELEELVDRLAAWKPTKVVLEYTRASDSLMNARYRAYLAGTHELARDEREQVGFRLARRMGHARVYGADWKKDMDFGRVMSIAPRSPYAPHLARAQRRVEASIEAFQRTQATSTITQIYATENAPASDSLHGNYLVLAAVNADTGFVGADVVAGWYERNLKIFANVAALAEPGDRLFVMFGSSHRPPLRDFFAASPDFVSVEPLPLLTGAAGTR